MTRVMKHVTGVIWHAARSDPFNDNGRSPMMRIAH